jgi:redox-sensitive bicupin YhaK (pirin superfamily)
VFKHLPAAERGVSRAPWLDSRHTFSFADFFDPERMGFRSLRVLNDDRVVPGGGFPTHGHRDMEILTWVLDGTIAHKDSMGHVTEVHAGELQRMTAGTGVTHSEFNASKSDPLHFLQIWIVPEARNQPPGYEQVRVSPSDVWQRVAARVPQSSALTVHQDVGIDIAGPAAGARLPVPVSPGRHGFLHVATGTARLLAGDTHLELNPGDGLAFAPGGEYVVEATSDARLVYFDLA